MSRCGYSEESERKIKCLVFQGWLNSQPVETTVALYANLYDQLKDTLGDEFEPIESGIRGAAVQALAEHHEWAAAQDPKSMMEICNGCASKLGDSGGCTNCACDGVSVHGSRKIKKAVEARK